MTQGDVCLIGVNMDSRLNTYNKAQQSANSVDISWNVLSGNRLTPINRQEIKPGHIYHSELGVRKLITSNL